MVIDCPTAPVTEIPLANVIVFTDGGAGSGTGSSVGNAGIPGGA